MVILSLIHISLALHEVKISEAAEDVRYYVGTNEQLSLIHIYIRMTIDIEC